MTIQRMLELLEIEHECMLRGTHDDCDRNCADCELVQDDYELHEMYTDVISLLKEQEPKPIVNKWHKNPLGDYSRLHCPWCERELDMQSAKEYVACPYCGKAVKFE